MTQKIEIDPDELEGAQVYKIMTGCIVPRPIAFVSTISRSGVFNAAPFSFFNGISHIPPLLCFSVSRHYHADSRKDTLENIVDTGEFITNIVDETLAAAQDMCSEYYNPDIDEFQVAGLTPCPSKVVKAPRVAESPVNFECRLVEARQLPESTYTLVIGRIVHMHLRKDLLLPQGRIDLHRLAAVGRMTGATYTRTRDIFALDHDAYSVIARADEKSAL